VPERTGDGIALQSVLLEPREISQHGTPMRLAQLLEGLPLELAYTFTT
jgi:hypothetical protein